MRKIAMIIIPIIAFICVILIILFLPITAVKTTERTEKMQISHNRYVPRETTWKIKWYNYDNSTGYNEFLGTQEFPATFYYNWSTGTIYKNYINYIRFEGEAEVFVPRDGLYNFKIGSDDGIKLLLDGDQIGSYQWSYGGSYGSTNVSANLKKGKHNLKLLYYEKHSNAAVYFDCPSELLTWTDTITEYKDTVVTIIDTNKIKSNLLKRLFKR